MFFVILNYRHPREDGPAVTTTTLPADRIDIRRDSVLVSSRGEQHVLDVPASARDEEICTALGKPFLWSISIEHQPRRSSHRRRWRNEEDHSPRDRTDDFEPPCPVPAGFEDVR